MSFTDVKKNNGISVAGATTKIAPNVISKDLVVGEAVIGVVGELESLSLDEMMQVKDLSVLCNDVLLQVSKSRSYFGSEYIKNKVLRKIKDGDKKKYSFDKLFALAVKSLNIEILEDGPGGSMVIAYKQMAAKEKEMITLATYENSSYVLPEKVISAAIKTKNEMTAEQKQAVWDTCSSKRRVCVIEGSAGAGKSFTMEAIKESYQQMGFEVTGITLSWSAAQVLQESAGLPGCKAIAGFLIDIDNAKSKGLEYFKKPTVIVVDEAGLVGVEQMHKIISETHKAKVPIKIVLSGDSLQLNPVEAGNSLEAIVSHCGSSRIDKIFRQKMPSQVRCVEYLRDGKAGHAFYVYLQQECMHVLEDKEKLFDRVVADYVSYVYFHKVNKSVKKSAILLALSNADVIELNMRIRKAFQNIGVVDEKNYELKVSDTKKNSFIDIAIGDVIVFRKNDKTIPIYEKTEDGDSRMVKTGLFNRQGGTISKITPNGTGYILEVELKNDKGNQYVIVDTNKYQNSDGACPLYYNFATTIYASQGQTVSKSFLIDSPLMNRRLAYVGCSRHTQNIDIYFDRSELLDRVSKILGKNVSSEDDIEDEVINPKNKELEALAAKIISKGDVLNNSDIAKDKKQVLKKNDNNFKLITIASYTWAKDQKNETGMMYVKNKRDSVKETWAERKANEEANAKIQRPSDLNIDAMFDFKVPNTDFTVIPSVDIALTIENVVKDKKAILEEPLKVDIVKETLPPKKKEKGFMASLLSVFKDEEIKEEVRHEAVKSNTPRKLNYTDLVVYKKSTNSVIENVGDATDGVRLAFSKELELKASDEFLNSLYGIFLDVNKWGDVRIISRNSDGHITNRISLEGESLMHTGSPFSIINKADKNQDNPMYLIHNISDYLYAVEFFNKKNINNPAKMPHLIWAYKETDYSYIAKILESFANKGKLWFLNKKDNIEDYKAFEDLKNNEVFNKLDFKLKNPHEISLNNDLEAKNVVVETTDITSDITLKRSEKNKSLR